MLRAPMAALTASAACSSCLRPPCACGTLTSPPPSVLPALPGGDPPVPPLFKLGSGVHFMLCTVLVCMFVCVCVLVCVCWCVSVMVCVCVLCWYVLVPMWLSLGVYVGVFLIVCRCVFCMLVSMCWCVCVVVCWCVCGCMFMYVLVWLCVGVYVLLVVVVIVVV